jgi:hypothetical protein
MRGPRTTVILAVAAAVALPYLFYLRFDHWETLRFLLPGLVPLSILAAAGVAMLGRSASARAYSGERRREPAAAAVVIVVFAGAFAVRSERLMRESSVWDIQNLEARYPLVGKWFQVNTPATSVAIAGQHSGSLRWYGDRQTLRWDLLEPGELIASIRELEAHGATVYAALEGTEQQRFDAKFSNELARLSVDSVGHVRNINFLRLKTPTAVAPAAGALPPSSQSPPFASAAPGPLSSSGIGHPAPPCNCVHNRRRQHTRRRTVSADCRI